MSKGKIGMTGRSKQPPKGDVRPAGARPAGQKAKRGKKGKAPWASEPTAAEGAASGGGLSALMEAGGAFEVNSQDESSSAAELSGCATAADAVQFTEQAPEGAQDKQPETAFQPEGAQEITQMADFTLVRNDKQRRSTNIVYTAAGLKGSVRFSKSAFVDGNPPAEFVVSIGDGIIAPPKAPRAKMTPEERKAARAAQPKLTLAEKVAKAEKRAADLKAKLEKQAAQPQPAAV